MNTAAALAEARDVAVSMLKQGKSAAEVWEALVSGGVDRAAAEALVRELDELRQQAESSLMGAAALGTQPVATSGNYGWVEVDKGNFWKGFFGGLCFSCGALLVVIFLSNRTMGRETKDGVYVGLAVNFVFGGIYWLATHHAH